MKLSIVSSLLLSIVLLSGCLKDECTETRTFFEYDAVFYTEAQIREQPAVIEPRPLINPGKMYFYKNYIFINEQAEGVHIYDISDDASPLAIAFIPITGNFDIAVKDNLLYADNVIDMVVLDISNMNDVRFVNRIEGFQERWFDESLGYYSHQRKTSRQTVLDCSESDFGENNFWNGGILLGTAEADVFLDEVRFNDTGGSSSTGVSGSFARFTILHNYLYTVNESSLLAWSLEEPSVPELVSSNSMGWGIETIFPYQDNLFIGSNSGMFIFDTNNPASPRQLARFEHAQACDPVVVQNDIAYVTLRNGSQCQGFVNQLDIIDVSSLTRPQLIESHAMDNPHGLAVRGDYLYLGEGIHGLKSFNISNSKEIDLLDHNKDHHVYDVISLTTERLLVVGDDGFYIYDSSSPSDLREISYIPVERT